MRSRGFVYIVMMLCFIFVDNSFSQKLILFEDFSSCSGDTPPKDWKNSGETAKWQFKGANFTHDFTEVRFDGKFVGIHDEGNKDRKSVRLETKAFSLMDVKNVFLSFDLYFRAFTHNDTLESFTVNISTDGGQKWEMVKSIAGQPLYHKECLDISKWAGNNNVKLSFNYSDNGTWAYGGFFDNIKVFVPESIDCKVSKLNFMDYAVLNDSVYFKGIIQNNGTQTINSVEVSYSVNSGVPIKSSLNELELTKFAETGFTHNVPWVPNFMGVFDVEVWVSKVNGQKVESEDRLKLAPSGINVVEYFIPKNVLLEVFAASWCTLCPDAGAHVGDIVGKTPNVTPIAIHIPNYKNDSTFNYKKNDPMFCKDGVEICNTYHENPGWLASGMIDRYVFAGEKNADLDRKTWAKYIYERAESVSPVKVNVKHSLDSVSRKLSVEVSAKFACDLTGDYRFNCYVIEDNIQFDQYSWYHKPNRIPYYKEDSWIINPDNKWHIVNFQHMNVLRDAIGGIHGVDKSLPQRIKKGKEYVWKFDYSIPEHYKLKNIKLVGMVKKGSIESEILNIHKVSILDK